VSTRTASKCPVATTTSACEPNWPPKLGWYPADLDDESIARHRADAARKKIDHHPAKKWAHLTELARQREVEAKGRAEVADLYE
jgi:hypothetical protein